MVISRSQYKPLTKVIFSSPEMCRNISHIFWGWIKTAKITLKNKLIYLKLSCLIRDHGVWTPLSCIGTLVSWNVA